MRAWAAQTLSDEELEAFDMAVSGTPQQAKLAVKGLIQAYEAENGRPPSLAPSAMPGSGSSAFRSSAEVVEAMRDPRYKKDPAYRAQVEQRLARSNVFRK